MSVQLYSIYNNILKFSPTQKIFIESINDNIITIKMNYSHPSFINTYTITENKINYNINPSSKFENFFYSGIIIDYNNNINTAASVFKRRVISINGPNFSNAISSYAFSSCYNLTTTDFPQCSYIDWGAF